MDAVASGFPGREPREEPGPGVQDPRAGGAGRRGGTRAEDIGTGQDESWPWLFNQFGGFPYVVYDGLWLILCG